MQPSSAAHLRLILGQHNGFQSAALRLARGWMTQPGILFHIVVLGMVALSLLLARSI
jgi:hypothetical protein